MDPVARLQLKVSVLCSKSHKLVEQFAGISRNLLESIFLLTLDQDFVLQTRVDGTVDLNEM